MISCQMFRKKSEEYIRHEVTDDMEEALRSHLESCPGCKEYLNEEIRLQKAFKKVINNNIEFKSLRSDILNSVDKNRYGKSPKARFRLNFLRHKAIYSTLSAACILFILISFNGGFKGFIYSFKDAVSLKKSTSYSSAQKTGTADTGIALENSQPKNDIKDSAVNPETQKSNSNALPQFKKEVLLKVKDPNFNTPWKYSPNKLLSASILNKGKEVQEEGIGQIGIKNNKTNEMWQFSVIEDGKQYSPKFLEWWDDESILLIYGYGYGTVTRGGDLYLMNINTGNISFIYSTESKYAEVTKASKVNNDIELLINVYDDDTMTPEKSHMENAIIKGYKEGQKVIVEKK